MCCKRWNTKNSSNISFINIDIYYVDDYINKLSNTQQGLCIHTHKIYMVRYKIEMQFIQSNKSAILVACLSMPMINMMMPCQMPRTKYTFTLTNIISFDADRKRMNGELLYE